MQIIFARTLLKVVTYFMHSIKLLLGAAIFFIFLFIKNDCVAQENRGNDTSYYVYFPGSITGRIYTSRKYTGFAIKDKYSSDKFYNPHSTLNLGVGATYHNFSLNLAYGFKFLNPDKEKTKYLDLQAHVYQPKWAIDFYGQFYKGFSAGDYYRGDEKISLIGLSVYRVFNPTRFSYRAALIQNEWQKKSAGAFLAGAESYYGAIKGDSSLINSPNISKEITKLNYFSFGPGVGYAYTLVAFQHWFLTGSLTVNCNLTFTSTHNEEIKVGERFTVNPGTRFRIAAGYNGRVWCISANWIENSLPFKSNDLQYKYQLRTGNYRFIVARRFNTGKHLQNTLEPADKILKE